MHLQDHEHTQNITKPCAKKGEGRRNSKKTHSPQSHQYDSSAKEINLDQLQPLDLKHHPGHITSDVRCVLHTFKDASNHENQLVDTTCLASGSESRLGSWQNCKSGCLRGKRWAPQFFEAWTVSIPEVVPRSRLVRDFPPGIWNHIWNLNKHEPWMSIGLIWALYSFMIHLCSIWAFITCACQISTDTFTGSRRWRLVQWFVRGALRSCGWPDGKKTNTWIAELYRGSKHD